MTESAEAPLWEELSELGEYETLCRVRVEHRVEVDQPLVLISQIQRSGGTLLLQLLDGHPECHVDPYELKLGHPKKEHWPPIDLAQPETWFETLYFRGTAERLRRTERTKKPDSGRSVFPFVLLPRLQHAIFEACVAARPPARERDVFDAYFTSYFNAWVDNENLYAEPKRRVVGFTPRMAMDPANLERFFEVYPDGRLLTIVRDPHAWWASAAKHMPEHYGDVDEALALWNRSADASFDALRRYGQERVVLLTYEELVLETAATMRTVAERIAITPSATLSTPTFNGRPVRANSSDPVDREGILPERATAGRESLDPAVVARIDGLAGDRYTRAISAR